LWLRCVSSLTLYTLGKAFRLSQSISVILRSFYILLEIFEFLYTNLLIKSVI